MTIEERTKEAYGLTLEETKGYVAVLRALGMTDNQIVARLKDMELECKADMRGEE